MMSLIAEQYQGLWAYLASGGAVMAPLVLVSLCMTALSAERLMFFRRMQKMRMSRTDAWAHIQKGLAPGTDAGAVGLLVTRFLERRVFHGPEDVFALDEAMASAGRSLDRFISVIGSLASLAPLLGLLGTVLGMMGTFEVLTIYGTGNPQAMANGISEALITTETGLVVAIPGLYLKSFLERRARASKQEMEAAGCHLRGLLASGAAGEPGRGATCGGSREC